MVRTLYIISVLTIISAVSSIVLLAVQHLQEANEMVQNSELTIVERFNMAGGVSEKSPQQALNPLVEQAQAFALGGKYGTGCEERKMGFSPSYEEYRGQSHGIAAPLFRYGTIYVGMEYQI